MLPMTILGTALLACRPEPPPTAERPVVVASARELDFGPVAEGDLVLQELTLRNDGGLPFGIASVALSPAEAFLGGAFLIEGASGAIVGPGEEIALEVSFAPLTLRAEDTVLIEFFEDEETAWFDRAHPWMKIRLSGGGVDLPEAERMGPIVGGIVPESVGVEVGGTVALNVRALTEVDHAWDVREGDGECGGADTPDGVYTAPDALPEGDEGPWVAKLSYIATDFYQNQAWDFIDLHVWPEGKLREPVALDP